MDPNFQRSVVLLTQHHEEGTIGFILNHPSALLLKDLIPELGDSDFPVYIGGLLLQIPYILFTAATIS